MFAARRETRAVPPPYETTLMTPWPTKHFTADDLDAFHSEALSSEMQLHLETCEDCRTLAVLDRQVLAMMDRLPSFGLRDGFADRVMARVTVGSPTPVPVLSYPRFTRRRIAALSALAAGMVASIAWSTANQLLLEVWLDRTSATLWNWGTVLWQQGMSLLVAQPWYHSIREVSGEPVRLVVIAAATIGLYASGIVALRRLVTPSSGSASDARA